MKARESVTVQMERGMSSSVEVARRTDGGAGELTMSTTYHLLTTSSLLSCCDFFGNFEEVFAGRRDETLNESQKNTERLFTVDRGENRG